MNDSSQDGSKGRAHGALHRSGLVTALLLAVALGVIGFIWAAHLHGRIHQLTTVPISPEPPPPARPGGQEVVHLERLPQEGSMAPEFTGVTLLPGIGLEVLQANLQMPGSTPMPILSGTPEGNLGKITGKPEGSPFSVLVDAAHESPAVQLVQGLTSKQFNSDMLPDGSAVTAEFAGNVSTNGTAAHTGVETRISTMLSGRGLDLTITAKNTGNATRGITIGWESRFLAPKAGLQAMTLDPPGTQEASDHASQISTPNAVRLHANGIDRTFLGLKHSYLSTGPELRLHNATDGYTLHVTALTPSIRSLHVRAEKDAKSLLVVFSTAAGESPEEARTMVAPGETLQWRIRLEATLDSTYSPPQN